MAVMFRKSAVLAAGNYQSVPYFEDYDLWVRMDQKGFLGANLPISLVYARIGNDMIGRRQGLSYCRHELFFLRRARETGFDYSILVNEKNSGVSFSRNRGLSVAHSEFVLFADSDDFFLLLAPLR